MISGLVVVGSRFSDRTAGALREDAVFDAVVRFFG
jgi:hypothetical protein